MRETRLYVTLSSDPVVCSEDRIGVLPDHDARTSSLAYLLRENCAIGIIWALAGGAIQSNPMLQMAIS